MSIYFSKYIFFLWHVFNREFEIKSKTQNSFIIKTKIKDLKLETNKKIRLQFFIIKYLPVIFLITFTISLKEIQNLDFIILLAPLYMVLNFLFFDYRKILIPFSILSLIIIFFFYNILYFPIFIKYLIISYVLIEFILDIFFRTQFYVYENNNKNPVAFAVTKKRSID